MLDEKIKIIEISVMEKNEDVKKVAKLIIALLPMFLVADKQQFEF
jgi:hypothetical protein